MKISWTTDHPENAHSSRTGWDEAGNIYHEDAAKERVVVSTVDGHVGAGWTPEEALAAAQASKTLSATDVEILLTTTLAALQGYYRGTGIAPGTLFIEDFKAIVHYELKKEGAPAWYPKESTLPT